MPKTEEDIIMQRKAILVALVMVVAAAIASWNLVADEKEQREEVYLEIGRAHV